MLKRTEGRFFAGFVIGCLFVAAAAFFFVISYRSGARAGEWVDHARVVIAEIDTAHVHLNRAFESAWRASMGVEGSSARYREALGHVEAGVVHLRALTSDNPEQTARAERALAQIRAVRARTPDPPHVSDVTSELEQVRSALREMTTAERTVLTERIDATRREARRQLVIVLVLVALALMTAALLFLALQRDLNARRRAARALEQSERRLLGIIDAAPNAVITLDEDRTITGWNPRAEHLFGWARSEVIGRDFVEAVVAGESPRLLARLAALARRAMRQGTAETRQRLRVHRRDGTEFPVELTLNGSVDDQGRVRLTAFLDDLTVREQTQQALAQARDAAIAASELKSEFLAHISHELRTPLNGVIGFAGLLRDTHLDAEQADFVEIIRRSGEHLLTIINDLLDLSKIDAGKLVFETVDFDLELAVRDVTDLLLPAAREKGLELVLRIDPDVPRFLRGDVGRVRQVLLNLLGNAVKFTDEGHVLLRISSDTRLGELATLAFAVEDTGSGVDEGSRERLFRSFEQGEASTKRRFGGTGLGLALSRQLVERMGGQIGYRPAVPHGSVFWFTLPLELGAPIRPRRTPDALGEAVVLLVEDSAPAREAIEMLLTSWGMRYRSARTGEEALAALEDSPDEAPGYDFVLIDDTLPDMSAQQLADEIRRAAPRAAPRFVLMASGLAPRRDEERPGDAFECVVSKPVRPSDLLDRMASATGQQQPASWPAAPVLHAASFEGVRVLLAEDNPVNQKVASRMLERVGCRVDVASDGNVAIDMAGRFPYDLVLMDCQMPDVDGYQATAGIRSQEDSGRRVPIVALTAHAMPGERERCIAAGMDDYLTKPVRQEALVAVLRRHVSAGAPAATNAAAPNGEAEDWLDSDQLLGAVDGDGELLTDLLEIFRTTSRRYLEAIEGGVRSADAGAVEHAAHALRGAAANFGATRACDIARSIELMAKGQELARVPEHLPALAFAVDRTFEAVQAVARRLTAGAR